jgi:hypothetical protein
MAWLKTLPGTDQRNAIQNGMWQLMQFDVKKAAEFLESVPSSNNISHNYSNLASNWAQQNPAEATAWVKGLPPGPARQRAVSGLLGALANHDPIKAAKFIEAEGVTQNTSNQVGSIASNWMMQDRKAALAWVESLDLMPNIKSQVISQTMSHLTRQDPQEASRLALTYTDKTVRENALQALVSQWGSNDPEATQAWIEGNLQDEEKSQAYQRLITQNAYQNPAVAVDMYREQIAGLSAEEVEKSYRGVATQIASGWAQNDPSGAADWALTLPEGNTRAQAVEQVVNMWGDHDVEGAANFVLTLQEGKLRDKAIESLVRDVRSFDPESAFEWAVSIGNEETRTRSVHESARAWKELDPASAYAAASAADIPPEAKERLLKTLSD